MYYYDCLLTGWLSRKPQNRFQHEKKNAQNTVASCTMGVMLTPMMPKNVNTMLFRNRNRKNQKNLAAGGGRAGQGSILMHCTVNALQLGNKSKMQAVHNCLNSN